MKYILLVSLLAIVASGTLFLAQSSAWGAKSNTGSALPSFNIKISETTTSGVSSGAAMANQLQIARSKDIAGAAIIASGPYMCAEGVVATATSLCMKDGALINIAALIYQTRWLGQHGYIDSTDNIERQKTYVFSGRLDTVVSPGVVRKTAKMMQKLGSTVTTNFDVDAEHSWVTDNYGNACDIADDPYIVNCGVNIAREFMEVLYDGALKPPVPALLANLFQFDQSSFLPTGASMGSTGYYYAASSCLEGAPCRLHVAFHGCKQTLADIGTTFVQHSQLNEIAEANDMIILYPQAKASTVPVNPYSCWDWWGYTTYDVPYNIMYGTKYGAQIRAVYAMIQTIAGVRVEI